MAAIHDHTTLSPISIGPIDFFKTLGTDQSIAIGKLYTGPTDTELESSDIV